MDMNLFRGVITAILLVAFIGLWIWAWSSKRRKHFDEAARLPFRDEGTGCETKRTAVRDIDTNHSGDSQ